MSSLWISLQKKYWLLPVVFVLCNALILFILFFQRHISYPMGWDAPFYITGTRELIEQGIVPQRLGFVALIAVAHKLTNISITTLILWSSPFIMLAIAVGTGSLVSAINGRSRLAFYVTFLSTLWSSQTLSLSMGTYDNALALAFVLLGLWIIRWQQKHWRRAISLCAVALLIGFTHFETYLLFMLVTLLYECIRVLRIRKLVRWWFEESDVFLALALAAVITMWHWFGFLSKLLTLYTTSVGSDGNASIPYAQSPNISTFLTYAKTGLSSPVFLVVAGLASAIVIRLMIRKHERFLDLFASYICASYAILAFAVFRGSIPINRAVLLLPFTAVLGYGWYSVLRFTRRTGVVSAVALAGVLYVLVAMPSLFLNTYQRYNPSISPSTYTAFLSLARYIEQHQTKNYVVVADVRTNVLAASAYYGLWTNWLAATRPTTTTANSYCVYMGTLADYRNRVAAVRVGQPEYNDTTIEGLRCVNSLSGEPTVFVIQDIQPASFPLNDWYAVTSVVAPHLGVVSFPSTTLHP